MSSPLKTSAPNSLSEYEVLPNGCEAHWEVVERILFIYAKLNPGIAYVQGMNEIVGPLYYTFATDPNSDWKGKHLECLSDLHHSWQQLLQGMVIRADEEETGRLSPYQVPFKRGWF